MLFVLIKKEIIAHVLTLRFAVTFVLTILLVFGSIYITSNEYRQTQKQYEAIVRESRQRMQQSLDESKEQDEDWRRMRIFWDGKLDAVPVPPLSTIVQGLTKAQPVALHTNRRRSQNISASPVRQTLAGLYPTPDFTYVVSVVLSLLALLLVFDTVCGEKEAGTLRLILSGAVPRHEVLLSKWMAGYLILAAPLVIVFVGGMVYAWATQSLQLSADHLPRLMLLLLLALLYISVFFTLGLFVSTTTHRSSTSLFICLFIWVMWILVLPNIAPVMAKIIAPAPSKQKIHEEKAALRKEIQLQLERLRLISGKLRYAENVSREEEKLEAELEAGLALWDRYYKSSTRRQSDWAKGLGQISPSANWVYAATALAQTGPQAHKKFGEGRKRLQEQTNQKYEDLQEAARKTQRETGDWKWPEFAIDDVPVLKVDSPRFGEAIDTALNHVLILAILNVVFFMAAFLFFLKYDVR